MEHEPTDLGGIEDSAWEDEEDLRSIKPVPISVEELRGELHGEEFRFTLQRLSAIVRELHQESENLPGFIEGVSRLEAAGKSTDLYYEGLKARLDGMRENITTLNHILRVESPAGGDDSPDTNQLEDVK